MTQSEPRVALGVPQRLELIVRVHAAVVAVGLALEAVIDAVNGAAERVQRRHEVLSTEAFEVNACSDQVGGPVRHRRFGCRVLARRANEIPDVCLTRKHAHPTEGVPAGPQREVLVADVAAVGAGKLPFEELVVPRDVGDEGLHVGDALVHHALLGRELPQSLEGVLERGGREGALDASRGDGGAVVALLHIATFDVPGTPIIVVGVLVH
mmetsp:Transcript_31527/g.97405  ORF Transcript_31527/g.97405 Transcript_31527/m.97405 type:complete len:210 (-) Transcript_31527:585-1214(-)